MYATLDDLIIRFGTDELVQLTDRADPPADAIDLTVVDRALGDAGELIDGYLAGSYQLPLDPMPDLVRKIACDVARFYLHADQPTEAVKDAYKEAVRLLERISNGTVTLQAAGIPAPAGTTTQAVFIPSSDRPMFGRSPFGRPSFDRRGG